MAELLGIVAGGAGLASLALQLIDGGQKLRHRYKDATGLQGSVVWLSEDLELMGKQLIQIEASSPDILQEQLGPIMLERCRSRSASVATRLASLTEVIPATLSKRQFIRATFRSSQWKGELNELWNLATGLKQDISQLYIIQHHVFMQKQRNQLALENNEPSTSSKIVPSTQITRKDKTSATSILDRLGITQCAVCDCSCSCHKKRTIHGTFWHLQYSPLVEMLKPCDNPVCTARRYRIAIQVALNRHGVPWKATLGLDLIAEPGRYSLQPCLQVEAVVDFTAPGFVILRKLILGELNWKTAEAQFQDLYKSNPGFVNQVNPLGYGYLEESTPLRKAAAHPLSLQRFGPSLILDDDDMSKLIRLFVTNFHTTEGHNSAGLMGRYALLNINNSFKENVTNLVTLGCDFSNAILAFDEWPDTWRIGDNDPYFIDFLRGFLEVNPGSYSTEIGDSPLLHSSVLFDSEKDFEIFVRKASKPLEQHVNFLGQTPLHIAVRKPSRLAYLLASGHAVDACDKYGLTPLGYAAGMNLPDAVMMLLEHGADLLGRDGMKSSVAWILKSHNHQDLWTLFWQIMDSIVAEDSSLAHSLLQSALASELDKEWYYADGSRCLQNESKNFWLKVVSKLGGPNISFDNGRTLMHFVNQRDAAELLVDLGFNRFNERDNHGQHSLFNIASLHDASLLRWAVAKGSNVDLHDRRGHSVFHHSIIALIDWRSHDQSELLEILEFLLDEGANVTGRDLCSCNCSSGGCIPGACWPHDSPSLWLLEWLKILEERELFSEAKEVSLSILRRAYFDEADLQHTCCLGRISGNWTQDDEDDDSRFWDIPEQLEVDDLNCKIKHFSTREYQEVKFELMLCLWHKWMKHSTQDWPGSPLLAYTWNDLIETKEGRKESLLAIIHIAEHPELPERISSYLKRTIQTKLNSGQPIIEYDLAIALVDFGYRLYCHRGDKFSSRLPLLVQLTDFLLAGEQTVSQVDG